MQFEGGQFLIDSRTVEKGREGGETEQCYWSTPDGVSASFGHGAAGVCLFLLYLYLATGKDEYLKVGRQGIAWILEQGRLNADGGLTWVARNRTPSYTPYWRWGSSGIGRVLLRYWRVTGDGLYGERINDIHIDCDRKYTIFPGYFFGLAGIVEFYMDLARFPEWEEKAMESAKKLLAGSLLFQIERSGGLAFPGESLNRISCDFGTGGAGIALVMNRYLTRCGSSFMVDELVPGWARCDSPRTIAGLGAFSTLVHADGS
ncbi:lanthionine synthetase C family protein [Dyella subtropica]|uniref:lanthionine synthetase C family protein n=1 Tax=Dyella subtropica TaxID=2992127 RepID=UPI0022561E1F|nr:lanthionine synthetase C family protein [Dyella subtropica]